MGNATNRWLDKLAAADKAKGGKGTDYSLAKLLEVDQQLMSKYRRELAQMGEGAAIKCADELGVHPMVILADIAAEKSRDARAARLWSDAAKHYGKKAAAAGVSLLAPLGMLSPGDAHAAILTALDFTSLSETARLLCILCKTAHASNDERFPLEVTPRGRTRRRQIPIYKPGRVVTLAAHQGARA